MILEQKCNQVLERRPITRMSPLLRPFKKALLGVCVWIAGAAVAQSPPPTGKAPELPEHLTIIEFLDFECPFSAQVAPQLQALIEEYPGTVQLVVKNLPLASHPHARLAHAAALAAKRQGKFEEMSDLLFHHQDKLERPDLVRYARSLNLNLRKFKVDLDAPEIKDIIAEDVSEAGGLAATETPTFFLNGQRMVGADWVKDFRRAVEQIESGAPLQTLPISTENSPIKGPKGAPVTIVEFSDLQCPFCARETAVLRDLLAEYPDQIQLIFKNFPLDIHPKSQLAHRAALAAARQDKFWEMHDVLFANQQKVNSDFVGKTALELGLDLTRFDKDQEDPELQAIIDRDQKEGARLGVSGTPSFLINGKLLVGAQPKATFEAILNTTFHLTAITPKASGAPASTLSISTEDSPRQGPREAPVTIVEFSDLQCPFCARETAVLRDLLAEYPDQIQLIFKNFPLDIHPKSQLAHRAALAAARQGKFWEMHDALFASQQKVNPDFVRKTALELGLDLARFDKDQEDPQLQAIIDRDQKEGTRSGVSGTPSFLINGKLLVGAQPKAKFEAMLNTSFHLTAVSAKAGAEAEVERRSQEPVRLVWYSDLESPLTPRAYELVRQAEKTYPGRIQVTIKHAPLTFHGEGLLAHQALLAAGAQGKFWPMHDLLIANQSALGRDDLLGYASKIGLDQQKFRAALDDKTYETEVKNDLEEARLRDVRGTPTFFINGARVDGLVLFEHLQEILEAEFHHVPKAADPAGGGSDAH